MPATPHTDAAAEPAAAAEPEPAGPAAQPAYYQPEPGPVAGPCSLGTWLQPPGLWSGSVSAGHLGRLQVSGSWGPQPFQPRQLGPRGGADSKPRLGHEILPVSPPLERTSSLPPQPGLFPSKSPWEQLEQDTLVPPCGNIHIPTVCLAGLGVPLPRLLWLISRAPL